MIYFFDGVFKNKSEKCWIYEVGLNQSQFGISVKGIVIFSKYLSKSNRM